MSFLTSSTLRTALASRLVASRSTISIPSSAFHTTSTVRGLKESDRNQDDLAKHYEAEKEAQLKSHKDGKAQWKQSLASNSESAVKADRGEAEPDDQYFNEMHKKAQEAAKRGSSVKSQ